MGDLPGWRQIFTDDFTTSVGVGSFPGTAYGDRWSGYGDDVPDTFGNTGGAGRYYPSTVLSVDGGLLNMYLHTENGVPMVAAPSPILPGGQPYGGQLYGRYAVRFRADAVPGYKTAWLLWPTSRLWPDDGEIDFPEGDLEGTISAFAHYANPNGQQDAFSTDATYATWHTAVTEWSPGRVEFFLDGVSTGVSTTDVPDTPMYWVLQTETCLAADCQPDDAAAGNVQVDWVAVWEAAQ